MTISKFEDAHFLREGVVDVNAAVVGISMARWACVDNSHAAEEQAVSVMRQYRFDVLPIVDGAEVKKYFRTRTLNDYSSISQEAITYRDVIPFHTHIRDVIKGFALEPRSFYFLQNENRIVGLMPVVNLNCRQVKVYLFSLLSELEIRLGNFIAEHVSEEELLKMTFDADVKEKHDDVKIQYGNDKLKGVDVPLVQYLYLADLINITIEQKLYDRLGYSRTQFEKRLGSLNTLRHAVAHPARAIITDEHSVNQLWERIDRVEEALFILR